MAAAMLAFLHRTMRLPVPVAEEGQAAVSERAPWRLPRWLGPVALVALALFLRRPDIWLRPQFFQEDGFFFEQNYNYGWRALFIPYSGYLHTAVRLAVWALGFLPLVLQPVFYSVAAVAVCLAVVARIFRPGIRLPHKTLLAVAVVLGPRDFRGEILGDLGSIQWFLALVPILMLVEETPPTGWRAGWDLVQLALVGLTGPHALLSVPLFAAKWLCVARTRWNAACLGVVVSCSAVQGWFIHRHLDLPIVTPTWDQWLTFLTWKPVGALLFGRALSAEYLSHGTAAILLVELAVLLVVLNRRQPAWRWPTVVFIVYGASVLLGSVSRFVRDPVNFLPIDNGDRYFFLPRLLLLWCLLLHLRAHAGWRRWLLWGTLTMAAFAAATDLVCLEMPASRWPEQIEAFQRGETDIIRTFRQWRIFLHRPSARDNRYEDALGEARWGIAPPENATRVSIDGKWFVQPCSATDAIVYELPPEGRTVAGRYAAAPGADGAVEFSVSYRPSCGDETQVLWRGQLDPARLAADRGVHEFEAALPPQAVGQVVLTARPVSGAAAPAGGCWADIRIR